MRTIRALSLAACCLLIAVALLAVRLTASDHADTFENFDRIGADLTDVFIFPSSTDPSNVVLVMNVHGLIAAGTGGNASFDTGVLYQFKIDTDGDHVENLVIQTRFVGAGAHQHVVISGPHAPLKTGTTSIFGRTHDTLGKINQPFSPAAGMLVFAGARSDPFFFDLNRFLAILPDRATPLTGKDVNFASIMAADAPQVNGFRGFPAGSGFDTTPAVDFLANLNVLSIIIELPRAELGGHMIGLWATTSLPKDRHEIEYVQQDRLARPAVNEVLATVTADRHDVNNKDNPTDDVHQLKNDILAFMHFPAGRSAAIGDTLAAVLVPDVMVADLSQSGKASYLGVETGGFTGGRFGGRDLRDDVVDIDLMAIFGNVIPALGLAPDDGAELAQFTTDNVGPHKDLLAHFPYLGHPH
jgi:hypothetical protein